MLRLRRTLPFLIINCSLIITGTSLLAQTVVDTVFTGTNPAVVAVNPATNRIYVVNQGDSPPDVTVINGSNDQVLATVPVGNNPDALVVNPFTNRVYVVNDDDGTVTLIDGATNSPYTIQVGNSPWYAALNTVTNKIYVTNYGDNTVSVIDGATNLVTTVPVRDGPGNLAVNPATNLVYVCNWSENTVSVINGANNTNIKTILVGHTPNGVVVNTVTNKIYVTNYGDNSLSIIDGSTNTVVATLALSDTPGGEYQSPLAVNQVTGLVYVGTNDANVTIVNGTNHIVGVLPIDDDANAMVVNSVTNKIYIAAGYNALVMIDGNTNTVDSVQVGNGAYVLDINQGTNRIYTANYDDNDVSVAVGANASPMQWYSVAPCRVFDSRLGNGPIPGGTTKTLFLPQLGCGIPSNAAAYSLNVTVAPRGTLGYLTIWPTGQQQPYVSTMNSYDARVKANAAIVPSGYSGGVSVYVTNTTDVILDIDGYFAPASANSYEFYPLPPCRVLDTRKVPDGPLTGPKMAANQVREFPILQSPCLHGVTNPQAYSFNVSVVPNPGGPLNYLTIWPADQTQQPYVSTLNNPTGTVVANGAIVPASATNGDVKIYTTDSTDVFVDINGYFAAPGGGLSMYPLAPCRAFDTRVSPGQPFRGTLSPPVNVAGSVCAPDTSAQAYIFNATVVPYNGAMMGYLTLWPHGEQVMPIASTLNAYDGWVTSNMAIVPNSDGSINAYADGMTHLILDISGYFAPEPSDNRLQQRQTNNTKSNRRHHRSTLPGRTPLR